VVVNGSVPGWRLVMSGVLKGSVLGPILFNIFLNDINNRVERTLSQFADDTKLWYAVNKPEGQEAIQRDLDRLEHWAYVNLMRFNKPKCKILCLSEGNILYQYKLGNEMVEPCPAKNTRGY